MRDWEREICPIQRGWQNLSEHVFSLYNVENKTKEDSSALVK